MEIFRNISSLLRIWQRCISSVNNPKCELPELKTRPSTGPILAAIIWPMLLDQYQRSYRPSVVPVLARYIGNQNFPCFRRSLAQHWHFNGLEVGSTPANCVVSQKGSVQPSNGHYWLQGRHYYGKPCCKSKRQSSAH